MKFLRRVYERKWWIGSPRRDDVKIIREGAYSSGNTVFFANALSYLRQGYSESFREQAVAAVDNWFHLRGALLNSYQPGL